MTYETSFTKLEEIAEKTGDWCDKRIDQARKLTEAISERHPKTSLVGRMASLLSHKPQHRLVMRSKCIGCNPQYWE